MTFRRHDRALCSDDRSTGGQLVAGRLYYVVTAKLTRAIPGYPQEEYVFLLGQGPEMGWNASRFRRVDGSDKLWPLPGAFEKEEET
jgi:hypothetical protein